MDVNWMLAAPCTPALCPQGVILQLGASVSTSEKWGGGCEN